MRRIFLMIFLCLLSLANLNCTETKTSGLTTETKDSPLTQNKNYAEMSEDEKNTFIAAKSDEILKLFGRTEGDQISAAGLKSIRSFLDSYVKRLSSPTFDSCKPNDWIKSDLKTVLNRANQYAPDIQAVFAEKKLQPQIGIYLAMIETEFCPCLQTPTGALGMFQLTKFIGEKYGLKTVKGVTSAKPDERCAPKSAAGAASGYLKDIIDRFYKNDAVGIPLAIAAYNAGEGSTNRRIADLTNKIEAKRISFWAMLDNADKLEGASGQQFRNENSKYVPKFFAAMIIGENPQNFGLKNPPLSTIGQK